MPLADSSERTASIMPTSKIAAANSSGSLVTARPTKMPPALPPQMPSVFDEV